MVRIGLIGAGRMGALHARNATSEPRLELALVADHCPDRATEFAVEVGARGCSVDELLGSDIDGVIVATSSDSIMDLGLAARRSGKAVFPEKPLSLSLPGLERAGAEWSVPGPPLFVAFNRRFDSSIAQLKARLDAGEVGRLESMHIISHDPAPPPLSFVPRSGGLFRDFTIHDFDTASWFLQEPIAEVFAFASCLTDPQIARLGDVDTGKLILKTASGKLCIISNSHQTGNGYDQRIEIFGSKGPLHTKNVSPTSATLRNNAGSAALRLAEAAAQSAASGTVVTPQVLEG